jgi:hypothetical protein
MLAVLPFETLTGNVGQDYFSAQLIQTQGQSHLWRGSMIAN